MMLVGLGVATVVALLAVWLRPREPSYQGRSLSEWVDLLYTPNHREAMNSISAIGPSAIPFLFKKARHENGAVQSFYRAIWPKLPTILKQRLPVPRPSDPNFPGKIGNALMAVGQEELPQLIVALKDRDPRVRHVAILAIQYMGMKPDAAVPVLCELLNDPDARVRGSALLALGHMGSKAKPAVPAFIATLRFGRNEYLAGVRATAAWALGQVGPDARMAVPWLRQSLSDTNPSMRQMAAIALWRINQETNVIPLVIEHFERNPQEMEVLRTLGEMGPLAKPAVATLLKLIRPPDLSRIPASQYNPVFPHVQRLAREVLKKIDPDAAAKADME